MFLHSDTLPVAYKKFATIAVLYTSVGKLPNIPKISSYRLKIPVASAYSNNSVINGINLSGRIFLSSNFLRTNNNRFKHSVS